MKTHVDSGNSILQISMESQENTSANSIKSRPINQRKRLSPAQRRKQITQEAVTLITQYGSYGFPMQVMIADAVGMTLPDSTITSKTEKNYSHWSSKRSTTPKKAMPTRHWAQPSATATKQIQHQRTPTSARRIARNRELQRQTSRNLSHCSCASPSKRPIQNTQPMSSTRTDTIRFDRHDQRGLGTTGRIPRSRTPA